MPIDLFKVGSDGGGGADSGSDSELCKIEINKDYARRLEHNKKREELQKYEELKKQGRISDSDSDSDDSDDSDELSRYDPKFYELLNRVKNGDREILNGDVKYFNSDEEEEDHEETDKKAKKGKKVKKEKPVYLKDANAMTLLANGPDFGSDEEEELREKFTGNVYNEEQKAVLEGFKMAEKDIFDSNNEEENDDLFKEKKREGEESENDETTLVVKSQLNAYYQGKELDENEKFLKQYLENQLWKDKQKGKNDPKPDLLEISEEEEEIEKQEKYEAAYNFRHEEEGMTDRVLGHSRVIEGSVRKKDSSRKTQRKSKKERMEKEERERREELKRLKNLKKKEIQEKLDRIRKIAGIENPDLLNLDVKDLEEEFNPDEYDKKMKQVFGSEYYEANDENPDFNSDEESGFEKPDFAKEDEVLGLEEGWDNVENETEGKKGKGKVSDEKVEMEGKKGKGKVSEKEKVEIEKDMEEYYKLDYEDTIGDLKTRFKYRSVPANRYGLKPWEILSAKDKDLNQYVAMKKIAPYREKEWSVTHHQKLKKDLILGLNGEERSEGKKSEKGSYNKGKGKEIEDFEKLEGENGKSEEGLSKKARRRKRQAELKLSQSRLQAYGKIQPKKQKKN
ncbi:hypothetical protein LUZ60_010949 [Juncus effusus]|nr:hypothetical protein LUZ60_010949 [Juncus effusus]